MGTAYQAVHVALRALQRDEFRREVVAVHGPLAPVANRAELPLVAAAEQAHGARVVALEIETSIIVPWSLRVFLDSAPILAEDRRAGTRAVIARRGQVSTQFSAIVAV